MLASVEVNSEVAGKPDVMFSYVGNLTFDGARRGVVQKPFGGSCNARRALLLLPRESPLVLLVLREEGV